MKKARAAFVATQKEVAGSRVVVIDESGVDLAECPRYGWSPVGTRCQMPAPVRGERLSMLGAIVPDEVLDVTLLSGTVDGEVFCEWLRQALVPQLRQGDVVVMDNLSVHKVKGVMELIEAAGAKVLFLPPYSPDFSPIENYWSSIKRLVRSSFPRTTEQLELALKEAMAAVPIEHLKAFFTHCGWPASASAQNA